MDIKEVIERLRNEVKVTEESPLTPFGEDIKCLLSEVDRLEARGKELEEGIVKLRENRNKVIETLNKEYTEMCDRFVKEEARRKELEADTVEYRNGQMQLQKMIDDLMDVNTQWAKRVRELEEGIEKYLDDPEFDTDILTKLIEKEKP